MKYFFSILLILCALLGYAQNISNVDFSVEGNNIVVTYDLADCYSCDIGLFVSLDGGLSFCKSSLSPVSGDVGLGVTAGRKRMVWNPLIIYPNGLQGDAIFEVRTMGNVKVAPFSVKAMSGSIKKPNKTFTVNGISFNMVYVGPGTFTMGATLDQGDDVGLDEKPVHEVSLSEFYIGETEVTKELWIAVMGENPSYHKKKISLKTPIENVSWNDINKFISKLNSVTGQVFSLPTEAQWEYAARGGNKSKGFKYSGSDNLESVAWHKGNSGGKIQIVATKQPNELGIYDMSGNVWEWCYDTYANYTLSDKNINMNPLERTRVYRGGCAWVVPKCCRVTLRRSSTSDYTYGCLGLRLVLAQ